MVAVVLVAWALATVSSEAQSGSMHNCPQAGRWAISVWDGADGTESGEALAACGAEAVDVAYALDPQTGGWLGWFRGRPEISKLLTLNGKQGVLALGRIGAPLPSLTPEPTPGVGEAAMHNCPQPGKWAISVWSGADGTATGQALAACGLGTVDFAYSLDPGTNGWLGYFEGRPEVSKLLTLNNMQGIVAHGAGGGFSLAVDKFGEGSITSSPGGIDCGIDCTNQAVTFSSGTSVVLTATADPGSTFSHWSGCGSVSGDWCTVQMGRDKIVFATFAFSEVKIPETTKVLDAATMGYLIRQDGSTYYFDSQATAVASLKAGDVIVNGAGEGFLRKVTAVSVTDQEIAVETTAATLEDAIERGTVILHKTLTPADLQSSQLARSQGPDSVLTASSSPFSSQFNVGLEAGIGLRGTLSFEPTLDFAVSFDDFKPVEARSVLTFRQRTDLALFAEAGFTIGAESKAKIWPPPGSPSPFPPIVVPVLGFPVVFVPELEIGVGVSGSSVASVETGVTVDATTVAGVHYTSQGGWDSIGDYSENFSFNPPTLSASAEFKTFVSPELSVRVYGVVGPYVNLEGYGRLSADPPWWGLYGGLSASAGFSADFPIIGRVLDYHVTPLQVEWTMAEAETQPTPTPTRIATATPTATHAGTPTPTAPPTPTPTPTPGPGPSGRIAFASDRDGNAEIYVMNADGTGQTRLTENPAWDYLPAWSPNGSKIAFQSYRDGNSEIYVMNADGSAQTNLTKNPASDYLPAWSRNGSKIAFESYRDGNGEIYVMNADGTGQARLSSNPAEDSYPAWSPDGSKIAFASWRDGNSEIYVMNADGTGQTRLTNDPGWDDVPAWSPDGSKIAFHSPRDGNDDIYVMDRDGTGQTRLTDNPAWDASPAWSPDGSKIAFASDRDGNWEIYAMNADGTDQTRLTHDPASDGDPDWSP